LDDPSVLANTDLLFLIHLTAIKREKQDAHLLPKSLSAAAVVDPPSGDGSAQLHFKTEWVDRILSPKLQMMLAEGPQDLQFPDTCIEEAIGLLKRAFIQHPSQFCENQERTAFLTRRSLSQHTKG
jgi:hypothetical protein